MKKTFFLSIVTIFIFSGCFSLNPFSDDTPKEKKVEPPKKVEKKEIETPDYAPKWLVERKIKNNISAIGFTKDIKDSKNINFDEQKALIVASNNLLKKIYAKTVKLYRLYAEHIEGTNVFEKDIKKFAEHISLRSLTYSNIKNSWVSENKELYLQIGVETSIVAEQIQQTSKLLFPVDKRLYQNFLSNRADKEIIKYLEKEEED